jgi:TPR repeat protein
MTPITRITVAAFALGFLAVPAHALPTACDLLATHPLDPDKITAGVAGSVVRKDLDTAIQVCRADVARDPDNPRLVYNLGRVLFYDQQFAEGLKFIDKAAASGHRQSLFVAGLIYSRGSGGTSVDRCRATNLWLTAARGGHYGSTLTLAQRYLAGETRGCVNLSAKDVQGLVDSVRKQPDAGNYFHRLLFDALDAGLAARQ